MTDLDLASLSPEDLIDERNWLIARLKSAEEELNEYKQKRIQGPDRHYAGIRNFLAIYRDIEKKASALESYQRMDESIEGLYGDARNYVPFFDLEFWALAVATHLMQEAGDKYFENFLLEKAFERYRDAYEIGLEAHEVYASNIARFKRLLSYPEQSLLPEEELFNMDKGLRELYDSFENIRDKIDGRISGLIDPETQYEEDPGKWRYREPTEAYKAPILYRYGLNQEEIIEGWFRQAMKLYRDVIKGRAQIDVMTPVGLQRMRATLKDMLPNIEYFLINGYSELNRLIDLLENTLERYRELEEQVAEYRSVGKHIDPVDVGLPPPDDKENIARLYNSLISKGSEHADLFYGIVEDQKLREIMEEYLPEEESEEYL